MVVHLPCGMKDLLGRVGDQGQCAGLEKKAQGHMREVLVSQGEQPDCRGKPKDSFGCLKYGDAAQAKVLNQKIFRSFMFVKALAPSRRLRFGK